MICGPQDQGEWLPQIFGIAEEGPTVQELGSVCTPEGRLITFSNLLQHQVQPFELTDPTKPGHRKMLALFLVDPNVEVVSTADVPCQRADWLDEVARKGGCNDGSTSFPINMEMARLYREQLMEERRTFVISHEESFASTHISLCEH